MTTINTSIIKGNRVFRVSVIDDADDAIAGDAAPTAPPVAVPALYR